MTQGGTSDSAAAYEAIQLGLSFMPARAVYAAAKLGIADIIGDSSLSAEELARAVDADAGALFRVLRVLATIGILRRDGDGRFALSPTGQTLRSDVPNSVRNFILLNHELSYRTFGNIMHSVETGESAVVETYDAPLFEYIQSDPDRAALFFAALADRGRMEIRSLVDAYDFSRAGRVVDVGGGNGAFLSVVLSRFDGLEAVLFDTGPVVEVAKAGRGGPLPRCEFVAGDFFESVPPGGDTYILKLVLHDWYDDDAVRLLTRCREAMGDDGRLLIIEGLIGNDGPLDLTHILDLVMLVTVNGLERGEHEYTALLERAGFALERVIPTSSPLFILEARPR